MNKNKREVISHLNKDSLFQDFHGVEAARLLFLAKDDFAEGSLSENFKKFKIVSGVTFCRSEKET